MISIVKYRYHKKITSDLENRSIEITQSEKQGEKCLNYLHNLNKTEIQFP